MANRYWIGGTGDWSDTAHWSTASGGSGGASVPTSSDDVYIDNASGSGSVLINISTSTVSMNGLTVTRTSSTQVQGSSGSIYTGNFKTYGNITFAITASFVIFPQWDIYNTVNVDGNTTGAAIRASSMVIYGVVTLLSKISANAINIFGTLSLGASMESNSSIFPRSGGTFNTNNYNVKFLYNKLTTNTGGTINFGTSTVTFDGQTGSTLDATTNTINASAATIIIENYFSDVTTNLKGLNVGTLIFDKISTGKITLLGSPTIGTFTIDAGISARFGSGTTTTITTLNAIGTNTNSITMASASPGSTWTIRKATTGSTVNVYYVVLQDSIGSAGTTWIDNTGTNNGNNTNWTFLGPQIPSAGFTYSPNPANVYRGQSVAFTDTSLNTPTSWSWNFGDGGTSSSQNPSRTYTADGTYTVSLIATNSVGSDSETKTDIVNVTLRTYSMTLSDISYGGGDTNMVSETAVMALSDGAYGGGKYTILTDYQELPQKEYEVRIYDQDDNFIAVLKDDNTEFSYEQLINQNASELTLRVNRSPDNKSVSYSALLDASSSPITDENGSQILVQTETANAVGPGTDIDLNYNVKIVAFYGGYDALLDENMSPITDENNEVILVQMGAPNGIVVYQGYIADYELTYGQRTGVDVLVVPHATEMSHYIFDNPAGETTITYGTLTDPVQMARDAMDRYAAQGGSKITYSSSSMPLSGEQAPYTFTLQRVREVQDKAVELLPTGYYQYVHPGENIQYLLKKSLTAQHTFYYEKHIGELKLRKSITQLINQVYFVGQENNTTNVKLFKYYEDTASLAAYRPGLEILADSRVSLATSAQILSQNKIDEFKEPRYRTTVTINDTVYDIETIRLGQMVGFKNFDNFVDGLLLQIVGIKKEKHKVTLELDMTVPGDTKRLEEIKRALLSQEVENVPALAT